MTALDGGAEVWYAVFVDIIRARGARGKGCAMKKIAAAFITILLLTLLAATASAASSVVALQGSGGQYADRAVTTVAVTLDGVPLETGDVPAFLVDGRTLVPVRLVSEGLGAEVTWLQDTQQVRIETGQTSITLTIGSAEAVVNGETVPLYDGVPAMKAAVDGATRTVVPLRFVSEQLGAEAAFDAETYTVALTSPAEETYGLTAPTYEAGVITVTADPAAQPSVFTLDDPDRVVIDFPGGVLEGSGFGTVAADGTAVAAVRYNQYDHGYGVSRVARVVLDLQPGASLEDLTVDFTGGVLTITEPETAAAPPEEETPEAEAAPLVVLDAGHGGDDVGAPSFGYYEKDLVLPITLAVGERLEAMGYRVSYTRSDDTTVSLAARAEQANTQGADIFVSIHANAFPQNPDVNGLETYHLPGGQGAKVLAECIHEAVLAATGANDREVRTANFYVLRYTDMPAVLVETGYLTNEDECARIADPEYQQLLADGIAAGIAAYLGPVAETAAAAPEDAADVTVPAPAA